MKSGLIIFIFLSAMSTAANASTADTSRWHLSAPRLNTTAAESRPLLSADGQTMYFVRSNHLQNIGEEDRDDIWVSYRDSTGMWSNSVNIGAPVNNEQNNRIVGVSLSNETIYLTNNQNDRVYVSKTKNRTWSKPVALELPEIVNEATELNCHVSIDEMKIVLSLANKNGLGKRDLFVCHKDQEGKWQRPVSLGPLVNSAGDERNMFLAADNRTLYFCTDGRGGFGGYDWFVTRRLDESWTNWSMPLHLGAEVNSAEDDLYFCINTELQECYGVSSQNESDHDIKRMLLSDKAVLPSRTLFIYGKVQTHKGEPVQSPVDIHLLQYSKPSSTVYSKPDGRFLALLGDKQRVGFYVPGNNSFAVMAYTNLTDQPLKVLDNSNFQFLNAKDSIHLYNMESIQIRLGELDRQQSAIVASRPKSFRFDIVQMQKNLIQSSDFEVNQNIEKIRKNYNLKYGKKESGTEKIVFTEGSAETSEPGIYVSPVEDIAHPEATPGKIQQMKKGFEEQKKKKETGQNTTSEERVTEEISEEEARKAIEELGQIDGGHQNVVPDFEVLLANMKNRIVSDEFANVKSGLEKELIWEWNGWKEMGFSSDEEKKMKGKVEAVQKEMKLYFEQKNRRQNSQGNVDRVLYEDDKIIYNELLSTVINSMNLFMKEEIKKEIDIEIKLRLIEEYRNLLKKNLEREKRALTTLVQAAQETTLNKETIAENDHLTNLIVQIYPLSGNVNIPLTGIFFQADSDVLLPESGAELSRIKQLLDTYPSVSVEIGSHTHGYCTDAFADDITERRCKSVKQALLTLGAESGRIFTVAYGKKVPLSPNNSREGRLKNQRMEMLIIGN